MIIKNAYIKKWMRRKDICSDDRDYDYILRLTKEQFKSLREIGFSAKRAIQPIDGESYWIIVEPYQFCKKTGTYLYGATETFEKRFLCRDDIDIDFTISEIAFGGKIIKSLYFNSNSIIRKEAQA